MPPFPGQFTGTTHWRHVWIYYIDFHRALLPYAEKAFIARFEDVTTNFGDLVRQFNQQIGTHYQPPNNDSSTIFSQIEAETQWRDPETNHRRLCCPSPERAKMKSLLVKELNSSAKITKRLDKARELYHAITRGKSLLTQPSLARDTTQLPI